jgi:hypothetical protein
MGPPELIHWTAFPEEFVIQDVFDSSSEFRAFYEAERSKLEEPVHWVHDPDLPEGIDCRCTRLREPVRVIRLRRVPAVLQDAARIAQQLESLVLDSEGFPATGALKTYESLSSALNSMIRVPIVYSRLTAYGFDLRRVHEQQVKGAMEQLGRIPHPPIARSDMALWMFNYVGKLLEWEVVSESSQDLAGEFQQWFDSRFPTVAETGQELFALVKAIGCDTPEKQVILFRKIIARYQLAELIFL